MKDKLLPGMHRAWRATARASTKVTDYLKLAAMIKNDDKHDDCV